MFDTRWQRVGREVGLAAFAVPMESLDAWVVDRLTEVLDEQYVRAGQVLWSAGEPVESLYFMHQGRVRASREGSPPWTFEGRWLLGGFEGHQDRPASRTFVALTDFYALKLRRREWLDLLEDSFELTRLGIVASARSVARLDERVATPERHPGRGAMVMDADGPLTTVERLAFLAELQMARGAGVQALADLASASHERILREGEALFEVGDDHAHFFLVVDGEVEATRESPSVQRLYGSGDIVTGPAAVAGEARHWKARARGPARLLALPIEVWFDLMEEHFDLAHSTWAVLATHRERLLDQLARAAGPKGVVLT